MYNHYGKKENEREKLTPEKIFAHQKVEASKEIIWGAGALVCLLISWLLVPVAISFNEASPWKFVIPFIIAACLMTCYCIYQILETLGAVLCAWGRKYRLEADTLERVAEGQREKFHFLSFKRFWRSPRFGKGGQHPTVTAYYFAKNGRATSRYISVHDGDFEGDSFYLVIREKDGLIIGAYNTKKYRLESEEN